MVMGCFMGAQGLCMPFSLAFSYGYPSFLGLRGPNNMKVFILP